MLPDEEIHRLLAAFGPKVVAALQAIGFFDLQGEYNPTEVERELLKSPAFKEYKAESKAKNSKIWDVVKAVIIGQAIQAGIDSFRKDYPKYKAKPSAQDYMNRYIKEHGGEFIKGMTLTDQKKLVNFIWANSGMHERPLARKIDEQPHLRYVLDQGNHRNETIIRTERYRGTSFGTWQCAYDSGFKTKTRHAAMDKRTRPSHAAMNGETVPINTPYSNGEQFCGENSINCRCRDSFA